MVSMLPFGNVVKLRLRAVDNGASAAVLNMAIDEVKLAGALVGVSLYVLL